MLKWVQVAVSEGHPIRVAGRVSSPHAQSVIALLPDGLDRLTIEEAEPAPWKQGWTSLMWAAEHGLVAETADLLERGASTTSPRRSETPYRLAMRRGHVPVMEALRRRRSGTPGASPPTGRRRRRGDAALHRVGVLVARSDCADRRVDRGRRGSVVGAGRRRSRGRRDWSPRSASWPMCWPAGRRWPSMARSCTRGGSGAGAGRSTCATSRRSACASRSTGDRRPCCDSPTWNTASQSNDEPPRLVSIRRSSSNCEARPGLRVLTVYLAWNYLRPGFERYVATYVDPQRTLISTSAQPLFREAGRS